MSGPERHGRSLSRTRAFVLAAALILAGALGVALLAGGWRPGEVAATGEGKPNAEDAFAERLRRRIEALEAQSSAWEAAARRRDDRLADLERVHRGLREELLALRNRLETVDRMVETLLKRQQGSAARAALAELDHLLAAAELRDRVLLDRQGALALLRAARDLAGRRSEPAFIEVERAISADLLWLERHHPDPGRAALHRKLSELSALAPLLAHRDGEDRPGSSGKTRGLGRLIHIERVSERSVPLLPEPVARLLLSVELRLLELSAATADEDGFERTRERLSRLLEQQFSGEEQARALAILAELAQAQLTPQAGFPDRARARVQALLADGAQDEEAPAAAPLP